MGGLEEMSFQRERLHGPRVESVHRQSWTQIVLHREKPCEGSGVCVSSSVPEMGLG